MRTHHFHRPSSAIAPVSSYAHPTRRLRPCSTAFTGSSRCSHPGSSFERDSRPSTQTDNHDHFSASHGAIMIVPRISRSGWQSLLGGLTAWQPPARHVVFVAPHPDDETLAAGGLIARLTASGVPVTAIAATDGERAYANQPQLATTREREQTEALAILGLPAQNIRRLRLPDSDLATYEPALIDQMLAIVSERRSPDRSLAGRLPSRSRGLRTGSRCGGVSPRHSAHLLPLLDLSSRHAGACPRPAAALARPQRQRTTAKAARAPLPQIAAVPARRAAHPAARTAVAGRTPI